MPASNQKLALSYAALVALGPGFRMRTEVLGEGRLDGAVWRGGLILKGYGDPTLDRAGLADLAAQVRAHGIRLVTGALVADESWFDARRDVPGWRPRLLREESRPLSALVADRALLDGAVATRPALAAAKLFRKALARARVTVRGPTKAVRAGGFPLAVRFSPTLEEILRFMDVESDNFTAEMLLKELGAVLAGKGTTAAGAGVVRSILEQRAVPLRGVRIADGSGLSLLDRLTPKALVVVLRRAFADRDLRAVFFRILPVAGRDGTLEHRMRRPPARGHVRAKTGSLREASALSGYVRERYAFAILQNGADLPTAAAREAQDRFAAALAAG